MSFKKENFKKENFKEEYENELSSYIKDINTKSFLMIQSLGIDADISTAYSEMQQLLIRALNFGYNRESVYKACEKQGIDYVRFYIDYLIQGVCFENPDVSILIKKLKNVNIIDAFDYIEEFNVYGLIVKDTAIYFKKASDYLIDDLSHDALNGKFVSNCHDVSYALLLGASEKEYAVTGYIKDFMGCYPVHSYFNDNNGWIWDLTLNAIIGEECFNYLYEPNNTIRITKESLEELIDAANEMDTSHNTELPKIYTYVKRSLKTK